MIPNRLTYPLHPIIYIYIVLSNSIIYPRTKYQFTNLKMLDLGLISLFTTHQYVNDKRQTSHDFWDPNSWSLKWWAPRGPHWGCLGRYEKPQFAGWLLSYVEFTTWHTILSCTFPTANRLGFLLYSHGKGSKISSSCSQVVVMSTPQDMASTKSFSHKYICFTLDPRWHVGSLDLWHCFVGLISGLYISILSNCEGIGLELEGKQSISCLTPTQSHCNLHEFFHIEPSL